MSPETIAWEIVVLFVGAIHGIGVLLGAIIARLQQDGRATVAETPNEDPRN